MTKNIVDVLQTARRTCQLRKDREETRTEGPWSILGYRYNGGIVCLYGGPTKDRAIQQAKVFARSELEGYVQLVVCYRDGHTAVRYLLGRKKR